MEYKTIGKRDFRDFVNRLIKGDHEINGVVRKYGRQPFQKAYS